jgi:hypothetical protein
MENEPQLHGTTIARRSKRQIQPREHYREQCGLLSKHQERELLKQINELTRKGLPPNHQNFRFFAQNICGTLPGKNWPAQFVDRHRDILDSDFLTGFDIGRKKADNSWLIQKYFATVEEKWKKYDYAPGNVYNMDEKGFMIGMTQKTPRIFTKKWKDRGRLQGLAQDSSRAWITLIACVCADGTSLPTALIYPGASGDIQDSWLEDFQPEDGTYFSSTRTGWTSDSLAFSWLSGLFDRSTKKKANQGREPRLLFVDDHNSHINLKFLDWCDKHNIHICVFPTQTTHHLQPLDVSLFSPLAAYYSQELDNWIQATQGLWRIGKRDFYKLFKLAYQMAFTSANIESAWKQTGLYPLNPSMILDQVSTKLETTESRPMTGSSGSQSSISGSDWMKINQVIGDAMGDALSHEVRRAIKVYHQLQAENALLKAKISSLKEAVSLEKRLKKPRKA